MFIDNNNNNKKIKRFDPVGVEIVSNLSHPQTFRFPGNFSGTQCQQITKSIYFTLHVLMYFYVRETKYKRTFDERFRYTYSSGDIPPYTFGDIYLPRMKEYISYGEYVRRDSGEVCRCGLCAHMNAPLRFPNNEGN